MHRKDRYTKKLKLGVGCQQTQMAPPPASASHRYDFHILPDSGNSVPGTSRTFLPPRSVPRPVTQMSTNNIQNSESGHVNLAANANYVDSLDQEADDPFVDSSAQSRKGRKTTEFWAVKIIDSDGTIKSAKLIVREAMKQPNGRKIVLRFNNTKQAIGDKTGLLSGVLGLLGSDYEKFSICKDSGIRLPLKTRFITNQIFYFDEVNEGTIKKNVLKSMGKTSKEKRLRLYNDTLNAVRRELIESIGDGSLTIAPKLRRRRSAEKIRLIDQNNYIPTLAIQKAFHDRWKKSQNNKGEESVEESYRSRCTQKKMVPISMMKQEQLERIEEIEQQDESSRVLSLNDSIAQVFGKEKLGRVRGVGFRPTPSQLFSLNSHASVNGVQVEETQRKMLGLQAELEGEKLKRKAMEDEAAAEKKKRQAMESALIYLYQRQGEEFPLDIVAGMSFVE
ncbi:hypothetical protein Ahy_A06g029144 [Arachis hypogaea]|uniref:Uncharacterized protein n=1 Tax=Arachis hypogaea TaxID=3818 RepID=A0A445CSK5_ARAHY|nr:hypothetical protein Ahy_A06g029144 [Arachis hypogaea]